MDKNRYKELFHEVERWVLKARQHFYVGNVLTEPMMAAFRDFEYDEKGKETQSPQFLEKTDRCLALSSARAFYYGLAIENATKAKQIAIGNIKVENGKPKGLRKDHNILEHVQQCGVSLNDNEIEFLKLLGYQTTTLSKYHIAKNLKSQNLFTGRAVGARKEELDMVQSIIFRVLDEERWKSIFKEGRCSKHIKA